MHSQEQMRKKAEARAEAIHHHQHSAVDGKHDDMPQAERMYSKPNSYEESMERGK